MGATGAFVSRPAKTAADLFRIEKGGTIQSIYKKVLSKWNFSTTLQHGFCSTEPIISEYTKIKKTAISQETAHWFRHIGSTLGMCRKHQWQDVLPYGAQDLTCLGLMPFPTQKLYYHNQFGTVQLCAEFSKGVSGQDLMTCVTVPWGLSVFCGILSSNLLICKLKVNFSIKG